jgi:hypothetical protein
MKGVYDRITFPAAIQAVEVPGIAVVLENHSK